VQGDVSDELNVDDCYLGLTDAVCNATTTTTITTTKRQKIFLVDSGATHHCVREKSAFSTFRPGSRIVRVANNHAIAATGTGEVMIDVRDTSGRVQTITLRDVFFVPSLSNNIFSTNRFAAAHSSCSISLAAGDKALCMPDNSRIALHSEHGLVWLVATLHKQQPGAAPSPSAALAAPPAAAPPVAAPPASTPAPAPAPAATPSPPPAVSVPALHAAPTMSLQLFHERAGHVNVKDCAALAVTRSKA
jgi:hypothetical protein